eukprot:1159730-Pelagomonas_calceolata.AAC.6
MHALSPAWTQPCMHSAMHALSHACTQPMTPCALALHPMRMMTHLHAGLIQTILNLLEHSPHPVHFYKGEARSGFIGNEGADACACTAAITDTTDIALPDARDPFPNFYWFSLKSSHGRNGDPEKKKKRKTM